MATERAGPARRRRGGRRRQRREPAVGQRHHRGAGVRPPGRPHRGRARRGRLGRQPFEPPRRARRSICCAGRGRAPRRQHRRDDRRRCRRLMADDVGPFRTDAKLERALARDRRADAARSARARSATAAPFDHARGSTGSTCATCCWSRRSSRRRRSRAPKAAARISARIIPACCRSGGSTRWCGSTAARIELTPHADRRSGGRAMSDDRHAEDLARPARTTGRWESYDVPYEPGQSVLDGLRWIRVAPRSDAWRSAIPASTPMPARNA